MKIWCFDDRHSSWGRMLFITARQHGFKAELFRDPRKVNESGFLFFRVEQNESAKWANVALQLLDKPGMIGIQNHEDILEYEDKIYQAEKYAEWFPPTCIIHDRDSVLAATVALDFPIVSKSRTGSGSDSVRLLKDVAQAETEANAAFGRGITIARELQKDYLLWQRFLPGNDHAYRVVRIGDFYFMLKVFNRKDAPFASGSGNFKPVVPGTIEEHDVFRTAVKFFDDSGTKWCGIDMLKDHETGEWKIIETTLAWNLHSCGANVDCRFFDRNGILPTEKWKGAHQFEVLLYEIERGVFHG